MFLFLESSLLGSSVVKRLFDKPQMLGSSPDLVSFFFRLIGEEKPRKFPYVQSNSQESNLRAPPRNIFPLNHNLPGINL